MSPLFKMDKACWKDTTWSMVIQTRSPHEQMLANKNQIVCVYLLQALRGTRGYSTTRFLKSLLIPNSKSFTIRPNSQVITMFTLFGQKYSEKCETIEEHWSYPEGEIRCKFSIFSLCLLSGEMTKANQRRPGGTPMASIPTLSRGWTSDAQGRTISPLSLSQFISLALKTYKAFLCWIQPTLRAVLRETMPPPCLFKGRTSTRKVSGARAAQETCCTWNDGEQGQRNAQPTHPKIERYCNHPF